LSDFRNTHIVHSFAREAVSVPQSHHSLTVRVLLVEDSPEDADLLVAELSRGAFQPIASRVWTHEQMAASLDAQPWDAIISDYHVPGFGAVEALAFAQARGFDGPFLVVSSLVGEETAVALMKAGAHDFVMKDNLARLHPALERELRDAGIRREKRRTQAELELRESQLRELTEFLRTVREEEQARIARELHDELGQILTSLKLDLAWLMPRLKAEGSPVRAKLRSMHDVIDGAVDAVHRIASDLRPAMLDDLGLVPAIEWQLQRYREATGAETHFHTSQDDLDVAPQVVNATYRIVQECLTNAARHAQATSLSVRIAHADDLLTVEIADNGRGFAIAAPEQARNESGTKRFGLLGLRERVQALGGTLSIESAIGQGTGVLARLPCKERGADVR